MQANIQDFKVLNEKFCSCEMELVVQASLRVEEIRLPTLASLASESPTAKDSGALFLRFRFPARLSRPP